MSNSPSRIETTFPSRARSLQDFFLNAAVLLTVLPLCGALLNDRQFSHLRTPYLPIFAMETFFGLAAIALTLGRGWHAPSWRPYRAAWIFLAVLIYSFGRGLILYQPIDVLRDVMLVGYGGLSILVYSLFVGHRRLYPAVLRGCALAVGFAAALRLIMIFISFGHPIGLEIQPASSALYLSVVVLSSWFLCPERFDQEASALRVVCFTALVLISVRTAWLSWALLIPLLAMMRSTGKIRLPFGRFFRVELPATFAICMLVIYLHPAQRTYLPIVTDIPWLARDSAGMPEITSNLRTRVWMWVDTGKELFFSAENASLEPLTIANEDLLSKAQHDPLLTHRLKPQPKVNTSLPKSDEVVFKSSGAPDPSQVRVDVGVDRQIDGNEGLVYAAPAAGLKASWTLGRAVADLSLNPINRILFGYPMGKVFLPPRVASWLNVPRVDPHNSLVSILYRLGVVGLVSFLIWVAKRWSAAAMTLSASRWDITNRWVAFGLSVIAYGAFHMQTDSFLESPYKALFFWGGIGIASIAFKAKNSIR